MPGQHAPVKPREEMGPLCQQQQQQPQPDVPVSCLLPGERRPFSSSGLHSDGSGVKWRPQMPPLAEVVAALPGAALPGAALLVPPCMEPAPALALPRGCGADLLASSFQVFTLSNTRDVL